MTLATSQILAPKTIEKAISQLELPGTSLQTLFGWGIGGTNVARHGGRNFSYDIFNVTRKVATGRVPGTHVVYMNDQEAAKIEVGEGETKEVTIELPTSTPTTKAASAK